MAKPNLKFEDVKKNCKFKAHQDNKCVNEKNKYYRLVHSCLEEHCPLNIKQPEVPKEATANLSAAVTTQKAGDKV